MNWTMTLLEGVRAHSWIVLTGLVLLGACAPQEVETEHVDEGRACLESAQDGVNVVGVDFEQCLSSSCDELLESSCTTTLEGTTLTIEAAATIRSKGGTCTADCGLVTASCETPPLAAGTYTVVYGGGSMELTVPGDTRVCADAG